MENATALRSFHYWPRSRGQSFTVRKLITSARRQGIIVSCAKTPESTVPSKSDVLLNERPTEKYGLRCATFPNVFEVGDFEMHLKRNIGSTNAPIVVAPPVPTEPMVQSAPATPSTSSKSSAEKANPFASASSAVSSKLASLEASGTNGFKLVRSSTVGSFRRGRAVKGKKQPPICKQGDIIKEGQLVGYIDQFGTELPVKSDVAGEVLKLLFNEGEVVGYGDPLVAVLPSFHGLNCSMPL